MSIIYSKDLKTGAQYAREEQGRRVLSHVADFEWYCRELDVAGRHNYEHRGVPEKWPCLVETIEESSDYGVYMDHTFHYRMIVKCESCGHTTTAWPQLPPLDR